VWGDGDGGVVRVQREEFDAIVLPGVVGEGLLGMVFFHGEASAVFGVAHGVELNEDDAALSGALRARAEEVPGAVPDLGFHRVATDASDEHAGFDRDASGCCPANFLGAAFRTPQAGGGFEAVHGDEPGELFFGGGCLDKAGEFVGGGLGGGGDGVHDAQWGGDGDRFDGPSGFGFGERHLIVGAGSANVLAEPPAKKLEYLVFIAADR